MNFLLSVCRKFFNFLIFYGISGFLFTVTCNFIPFDFSSADLPLFKINSFLVLQNRLVVGNEYYGRIQIYDLDGNFIIGKHIKTGGGVFKIVKDGENHFKVFAQNTNLAYTFNSNAGLISLKNYTNSSPAVNAVPNYYSLQRNFISDEIIKTINNSDKQVIVSSRLFKLFFLGPILGWLIFCRGNNTKKYIS